jgi:hypothetical protein
LPHATTATFTASEDWLYVSFRDDAEGEVALKFKRRHWWGGFTDGSDATYHCLVELELGPTLGFDGSQKGLSIVVGVLPVNEDTFVFLSKGRDGSLIVNYRNLQVFFPFYWGWAHSFCGATHPSCRTNNADQLAVAPGLLERAVGGLKSIRARRIKPFFRYGIPHFLPTIDFE